MNYESRALVAELQAQHGRYPARSTPMKLRLAV
jgi:hypothetical protein